MALRMLGCMKEQPEYRGRQADSTDLAGFVKRAQGRSANLRERPVDGAERRTDKASAVRDLSSAASAASAARCAAFKTFPRA